MPLAALNNNHHHHHLLLLLLHWGTTIMMWQELERWKEASHKYLSVDHNADVFIVSDKCTRRGFRGKGVVVIESFFFFYRWGKVESQLFLFCGCYRKLLSNWVTTEDTLKCGDRNSNYQEDICKSIQGRMFMSFTLPLVINKFYLNSSLPWTCLITRSPIRLIIIMRWTLHLFYSPWLVGSSGSLADMAII